MTCWISLTATATAVRAHSADPSSALPAAAIPLCRLRSALTLPCFAGVLIDFPDFEHALREHFGYVGSSEVLSDVYKSCDKDGSGRIGVDELFHFVRGDTRASVRNKQQTRLVKGLTLQPAEGEPGCELNLDGSGRVIPYDLHHVWAADDFRLEACGLAHSQPATHTHARTKTAAPRGMRR
jgi:hypothetical protein